MQPPRPWWDRARERGLQALDLSLCITSAVHYWVNPEGRKVVEIKYDAVGQSRINIHWTDDRVILLQAAFSSSYCSKYLTFSVDSSSTHERIRVRDTSAVAVSIARVKIQTVGNSTHSTMSPFSSDDHPRRSQPGLSCTFKGNRRECATDSVDENVWLFPRPLSNWGASAVFIHRPLPGCPPASSTSRSSCSARTPRSACRSPALPRLRPILALGN